MQIAYRDKKIEEICTNYGKAEKKHGKEMAERIHLRIKQIASALSVEMLLQFRIGRCHRLKGERREQYAMDLVHPYRLIFEKRGEEIQIAYVMEVVDYH